jgi:hypothetical protein
MTTAQTVLEIPDPSGPEAVALCIIVGAAVVTAIQLRVFQNVADKCSWPRWSDLVARATLAVACGVAGLAVGWSEWSPVLGAVCGACGSAASSVVVQFAHRIPLVGKWLPGRAGARKGGPP